MKDVQDKKGWMYDETLFGEKKTSVDAHFDEKRARELGASEEEISESKKFEGKGNILTVVLAKE